MLLPHMILSTHNSAYAIRYGSVKAPAYTLGLPTDSGKAYYHNVIDDPLDLAVEVDL